MGVIISMINAKGGVAKTTSCINIGDALSKMGRRVLLVDFDPQGGLSGALGFDLAPDKLGLHMADVILDDVDIHQVIRKAPSMGVDVAPTNIDLVTAEFSLIERRPQGLDDVQWTEHRSRRLIRALASVRDEYDYIIVDNQPTLGLLSMNALAAADGIIIPVACEYMALLGFQNVLKLIDLMQRSHNAGGRILGVIPTMFDTRTNHSREMIKLIGAACKSRNVPLFRVPIPRSVRFQEAPLTQQSVLDYWPGSDVAAAYIALAQIVDKAIGREGVA